jgi:hypothetical protein
MSARLRRRLSEILTDSHIRVAGVCESSYHATGPSPEWMLVIAAVTDPDGNARESAGERFRVWRIFAGKRRDRGKHRRLTARKSPNTVGSDAESSEQRPTANNAGRRQTVHDSLNGPKGGTLPASTRLRRNDKERKEPWVMKQLVVRLFDLTRKAAAAGDCRECLQASIPTFPETV